MFHVPWQTVDVKGIKPGSRTQIRLALTKDELTRIAAGNILPWGLQVLQRFIPNVQTEKKFPLQGSIFVVTIGHYRLHATFIDGTTPRTDFSIQPPEHVLSIEEDHIILTTTPGNAAPLQRRRKRATSCRIAPLH